MERRHRAPAALMCGFDRGQPEPARQHPVKRRRRAAALDVAKHCGPGLITESLLDLPLEALADPAEPRMPELVDLARHDLHRARLRRRALGDHDDREIAPALVAVTDQPAD